jgi:hypothetical protein
VKDVGTHPQGSGLLLGREVVVIRLIHRDTCEPRFCAAGTMHRARPSDFRSMRGLSQDFFRTAPVGQKNSLIFFFQDCVGRRFGKSTSGNKKPVFSRHKVPQPVLKKSSSRDGRVDDSNSL